MPTRLLWPLAAAVLGLLALASLMIGAASFESGQTSAETLLRVSRVPRMAAGLLAVTLIAPGAPIWVKMAVAALAALAPRSSFWAATFSGGC